MDFLGIFILFCMNFFVIILREMFFMYLQFLGGNFLGGKLVLGNLLFEFLFYLLEIFLGKLFS